MENSIIITMAGRGSRFVKEGYSQPKYQIEVNGRNLFQWSLLSLSRFTKNAKWFFVTLEDHAIVSFLKEQCGLMGVVDFEVVELPSVTSGQAESALRAAELCDSDSSCLIYNIDTHFTPESLGPDDMKGDGCVPCFDMPGDHWSFVKLGPDGCAREIREKKRISNMCSVGLYWFAKAEMFIEAYRAMYGTNDMLEAGETYIAPLYNHLVNEGYCVTAPMIPVDAVTPLGTPEEVKLFAERT